MTGKPFDAVTGRWVSTFDADLFEQICDRVEAGEFTAPILRELGIKKATFYDWLNADTERAARYGIAKEAGEEIILADSLAILDAPAVMVTNATGSLVVDTGDVSLRKVRTEGRAKLLAKFNPKRWGDKVEHSGKLTVSHEDFLASLK